MPLYRIVFLMSLLLSCTSPQDAALACEASCDVQQAACAAIDLEGCYDLCAYVVATIENRPKCLRLATEQWQCDTTRDWECSLEYDIVGQTTDTLCAQESNAFINAECAVD